MMMDEKFIEQNIFLIKFPVLCFHAYMCEFRRHLSIRKIWKTIRVQEE